jgi:hypothetical protein
MRRIAGSFWTRERDKQLQKLEAAGLSGAQIAAELGTTRNAVIARSARLRGVVYPCIVRREKQLRTESAVRRRERKRRMNAALSMLREALARRVPRNAAIVAAGKAGATHQAIGEELGISRERVRQIIAGR